MNVIKTIKHLCPAPFTGLTISPNGNVVLCCASQVAIAHMNNIESLSSFFNSSQMQYYRNTFIENKQKEVLKMECISCHTKNDYGVLNRIKTLRNNYQYVNFDNDFTKQEKTIRYLEFTTSNICNQSCAMCNAQYSSKWVSIERAIETNHYSKWIPVEQTNKKYKNYVMSKHNIQQIIDVLSGLEHLVIKGGEPFADENNLKILEELNKVNPTCNVKIISNCSSIEDSMLEVLKERSRQKPVKVVASVDGIDDLYYWIRSTKFDKTIETLEKIYNVTQIPININITVSLYNVFNLLDIFEFFYDKPYVHIVVAAQSVQWPRYCSPGMLPLNILEGLKSNIQQHIKGKTEYGQMFYGVDYNWWELEDLQSYEKVDKGIYDEYKPKVKPWITNMNSIRGMDLYNIVPELRGIF